MHHAGRLWSLVTKIEWSDFQAPPARCVVTKIEWSDFQAPCWPLPHHTI